MTNWNPSVESSIRKVGDYVEAQMKDLLNPKATAVGSMTRIVFRAAATGFPAMKEATAQAGWNFTGKWSADLQRLADIADSNGSDAAEKIKKSLPHVPALMKVFKSGGAESTLQKIRLAKKQGIKY